MVKIKLPKIKGLSVEKKNFSFKPIRHIPIVLFWCYALYLASKGNTSILFWAFVISMFLF